MNNFQNFHLSVQEEEDLKKLPILDRVMAINKRKGVSDRIHELDTLKRESEDGLKE